MCLHAREKCSDVGCPQRILQQMLPHPLLNRCAESLLPLMCLVQAPHSALYPTNNLAKQGDETGCHHRLFLFSFPREMEGFPKKIECMFSPYVQSFFHVTPHLLDFGHWTFLYHTVYMYVFRRSPLFQLNMYDVLDHGCSVF